MDACLPRRPPPPHPPPRPHHNSLCPPPTLGWGGVTWGCRSTRHSHLALTFAPVLPLLPQPPLTSALFSQPSFSWSSHGNSRTRGRATG
eukprot:1947809-Pyramimonas_sp.AAC.1